MRAQRFALAVAGTLGLLAPTPAAAQATPSTLLDNFRPMQKDMVIDYDTPTDKAAVDACKVETINTKAIPFAYVLRDGQGRILRMFADTDGKKDAQGKTHLDRWSYYKDGFEVYREIDRNEDGVLDECRWLNSGGTRVAEIEKNRITRWTRISPEEVSKVVVQALVTGNAPLLQTVLATPEDLSELGLPAEVVEAARGRLSGLAEAFPSLRKGLTGWDGSTAWSRFDGTMPHVIPADAGLKGDLILYENVFIFANRPDGQGDPMAMAYLQASDLVKVGDAWKLASLPQAINPSEPATIVADAGLRSAIFRDDEASLTAGSDDPVMQKALDAVAQHDQKAPTPDAPRQEIAQYHVDRVKLLRDAISAAKTAEEKLYYTRQAVDNLAAAYQTGMYGAAVGILDQYAGGTGPIASYAAYRKALAEFALAADQPGADYLKVQKDFLTSLEGFLTKYPKCPEEPDVLLYLASNNEFNAEEELARKYYQRLAAEYPESDPGRKAQGALRRLDLVGKALELSGASVSGGSVNADQFRGKTLLVMFWTTAETVRNDLPELVKVYQDFKPKGFEIVAVNLDTEKAVLDGFLQANRLPWPVIHEPGGMDSRLADEFGIISLPTMFLADKDGKVLNRNLRNSDEVRRYLESLLNTDQAAGVTSGATR